MLDLDQLKKLAKKGEIDTVLVCLVDMQGRLMGKRFHVEHFLQDAWKQSHCCDYLLATDLHMATPDGYASTSWETGYGDYIMKPDLSTLRPAAWLEKTAMVICDVLDHHTHKEVAHSPRAMLKKQVKRLREMGYEVACATELEFFMFEKSYDQIRKENFRDLEPFSGYKEDYHILQTTKEEHVMRPLRNKLRASGIPVEGTKGEAEAGQEELNIKYADALATAEYHTIAKHATKEIAWQQGNAITFLPKWHHDMVGSSTHIHLSLTGKGKKPLFYDKKDALGMSQLMKHSMAGLLAHAAEYTYFLAPYINSYKRFQKGTFAPTRTVWAVDNRTAGFRLCEANTKSVRIECRIGGSDLNPYLSFAAMLAAMIRGIEKKSKLEPQFSGDAYAGESGHIPSTLRDAREAMRDSKMLRAALGKEVVHHYCRAAEWEIEEFNRVVTDHEIARGFELA